MIAYRRIALALVAVSAAVFTIGAGKPSPANWLTRVAALPNGAHRIGNPAAKVRLVEYVSYTCSHCAAFEKEASGELALGLLRQGTGSIEYRPFLRNIIDAAATLMVGCGDPARFAGNHAIVLRAQEKWFTAVPMEKQQRWTAIADFGSRMRAVAGDMNLYPLFEARGYSRVDLDRCLGNEALAHQIAMENQAANGIGAVNGTPSFLINDRTQDAHSWQELRPSLMALTR